MIRVNGTTKLSHREEGSKISVISCVEITGRGHILFGQSHELQIQGSVNVP